MGRKPTYEELEQRVKELEIKLDASKKVDQNLLIEKQFSESVINCLPGIFYLLDKKGKFYRWNENMKKVSGYSTQEISEMSPFDFFVEEDKKILADKINEVFVKGKSYVELDMVTKRGKKTPYYFTGVRTNIGNISYLMGMGIDITERKRADEALQESEENFRTLAENANDGILIAVGDGRFAYANRHAAEITGHCVSELVNMTIKDLSHPDELNKIKERYKTVIAGKPFPNKFETIIIHKNGEAVPVEVTSSRSAWHGQPADIVIIRDISERKKIEEKLQESKATFEAVIESLPFDVFALDRNNRYILQNPICKKNWGDLIGKSPEGLTVDKNTKNLWLKNNRRALSGETVTGEVLHDRLNGEKSHYYNIISPIRDKEKIFGILGVLIDITDLKRVEEALRESRERFRNLAEITSDWIWEVDKNGFYTYVSPKIYDMLGYGPEEVLGKKPFDLMPAEEAERVSKIFNAIRASQKPFECLENINLHKDGYPVFFETSGVPIFNTDGGFYGYRGVDRDITQRKRSEKELQKAHDELEKRVEERTRELKLQKNNLEEANIALQVLLDKRKEDKKEMEDIILVNIKELVAPYLEKIKQSKLDNQQEALLSIMESNLNEIISPFVRKMPLKYLSLTPTEIQMANLIRHGRNSKDISLLMGLSLRTIYNHRKNIRKKIGIEDRNINLRSHLLSIF